ncbi:MAG TPA: amidohydrolase [Gemmatimonadetes bacterium]|jgi:amidohydrolase|nr:amidohydrolase [Gemmatimonadota bacterium]
MNTLIDIRHDLHRHPELAYEETRTSEVVQRELAAAGVAFVGGLAGGTGVLAHIPGGDGSPLALRADMDALPIVEQTGLPYASETEGRMHACGHDGHTTILIGVARELAKASQAGTLGRPVTLVFQPAEEGGAGAKRMLDDGCLDGSIIGPAVERIFGLHGWPALPLGVLASRSGPILACADGFEIRITGRGGHAAMPHLCVDPIAAAAAVIQSAQHIVSRRVDPIMGGVLSITRIEGGTTHNIIPESVYLQGTTRFLDPEAGIALHEGFDKIVSGVAAAHGCTAEIDWQDGYPITYNAPEAYDYWDTVTAEAFSREQVQTMGPVMGGEDFSYYGEQIPACFFALGLCPAGEDSMPGLHHPSFDFNDEAIPLGIKAFLAIVNG